MIKDIVVSLSAEGPEVAGSYAVSIAETFGAHAMAVAFALEPVIPATFMGGFPAELIESQRAESEKGARAVMAAFDESARRAGVSAQSHLMTTSLAGASEAFGRIGRRFDLCVARQAEPDKLAPEDLIIEGALFGSGRPVVVVPYIQKGGLKLDRIMVCWDGGRNAARAIADAMPLLAKAKAVEVVIIASEAPKSDEVPGADMGEHLARHGLRVDVKRIVAKDTDIASTLLSHAADSSADFMVMGGYGHSRLREFVFGGATRGILGAMTVPVLMSH
jgi:nucleotide-binding universal stress UspA family protein